MPAFTCGDTDLDHIGDNSLIDTNNNIKMASPGTSSQYRRDDHEERQPPASTRSRKSSSNNSTNGRSSGVNQRRTSAHGATDSHFGDGRSVKTSGGGGSTVAPSSSTRNRRSSVLPENDDEYRTLNDDGEMEVDYDRGSTELYRCIENKDWDAAINRVHTAPAEASTWVSRREPSGKLRWRLLPLHAVCIFRAPLALIEMLIDAAPTSPQMKDDQGMLPIHLACRNGASKGVVLTLLEAFPESVYIRDRKKRGLQDLVQASNSQNKESVLDGIQRFQDDLETYGQSTTQTDDDDDGEEYSTSLGTQKSKTKSLIRTNSKKSTKSQQPGISKVSSGVSKTSHKGSKTPTAASPGNKSTSKSLNGPSDPTSPSTSLKSRASNASEKNIVTTVTSNSGVPLVSTVMSRTSTHQPEEFEVDYEHRTQLFRLILKKDWTAVVDRAKMYPVECATWIVTKGFHGSLRFLPIHKACVLQPPASVIQILLENYPMGAKQTDQDGWLPIHCASFYGAGDAVVDELIKANTKGCGWKDDDGRLPIHYACLKGADIAVVESLLKNYPRASAIKDEEGRLPLHHACSKGANANVVDALLKTYPKGAQIKDEQGRLALHHATRKSATERTVRTLLTVYPRAAQIKDDQDKLPIHYACSHSQSKINKDVVQCLAVSYPESVFVENGFGQTPITEIKEAIKNNSANNDNATTSIAELQSILALLQKTQSDVKASGGSLIGSTSSKGLAGNSVVIEARIKYLETRIEQLEQCFLATGQDIKASLKKGKDPTTVLEKLSRDFLDMSISVPTSGNLSSNGDVNNNPPKIVSSTGSNQKIRHSTTPIKNLFTRNKK